MVGSISPCCEKRITTASTCEGEHPTRVLDATDGPITDEQVDLVLVPFLREIAVQLVAGGRQPDQALDDIGRAVDILAAELQRERMAFVERTGELPG
jgi:hypothetical protein